MDTSHFMVRKAKQQVLETIRPPSKTGVIKHGKNVKELPLHKIRDASTQYISAYCAPDDSLQHVHEKLWKVRANKKPPSAIIKGISNWSNRKPFAYGTTNSLYESDTETKKQTGDPVADSLAIITRENCAILALADGVNWGAKSKLAANCCTYGAITYIDKHLRKCRNTREVFTIILRGFSNAQTLITDLEGTMSTLCVGVVVELDEKDRWAFCVVNVGDSYGYVYNKDYGIKEVTENSHPIDELRDMRFSGGALGLADGCNPDLKNLTCSCILLEKSDVVFLCSDGISDNFDPKVVRCVPKLKEKYKERMKPPIGKDSVDTSPVNDDNDDDLFTPMSSASYNSCDEGSDTQSSFPLRHADGSIISCNDSAQNSSLEDSGENHKNEHVVASCCENSSEPQKIDINNQSNSDSAFSNNSSVSPDRNVGHFSDAVKYSKLRNTSNGYYSSSTESLTSPIENDFLFVKHLKRNPRLEKLKGFPESNNKIPHQNNFTKAALERSLSIGLTRSQSRRPSIDTQNKLRAQSVLASSCPDLSYGAFDFNKLSGRIRHYGALQNLEEAIVDAKTPFIKDGEIGADEICTRLLTQVFRLTSKRREILEETPQNQVNKLSVKERRQHNEMLKRTLEDVPGKLDHVSVVAFSMAGLLKEVERLEYQKKELIHAPIPIEPGPLIATTKEESSWKFLQNIRRRKSEPPDVQNRNLEMSENVENVERIKAATAMR